MLFFVPFVAFVGFVSGRGQPWSRGAAWQRKWPSRAQAWWRRNAGCQAM